MSKFAEIVDNKVVNVILADQEFVDTLDGVYVQSDTAGVGYDYIDGKLIPPQPFDSWTLVGTEWQPPAPMPVDGSMYFWDEEQQQWQVLD